MAELVKIRQRIKAIEVIKKITHAMRLISMSTHSRLKHKENTLETYYNSVENLFYKIKEDTPSWHNPILMPKKTRKHKNLIILIGSQKGLCGTFNTLLFKSFDSVVSNYNPKYLELIGIGKKAVDYLNSKKTAPLIASFNKFSPYTSDNVLKELTEIITKAEFPFRSITIVSNVFKSFFVQKPRAFTLIPLIPKKRDTKEFDAQDYIWEQPPHELLDRLAYLLIQATLQNLLFQSLLSEQASRFLSMDSATRNAQTLLEETDLIYNKLRQAKITKELSELSFSY